MQNGMVVEQEFILGVHHGEEQQLDISVVRCSFYDSVLSPGITIQELLFAIVSLFPHHQ